MLIGDAYLWGLISGALCIGICYLIVEITEVTE